MAGNQYTQQTDFSDACGEPGSLHTCVEGCFQRPSGLVRFLPGCFPRALKKLYMPKKTRTTSSSQPLSAPMWGLQSETPMPRPDPSISAEPDLLRVRNDTGPHCILTTCLGGKTGVFMPIVQMSKWRQKSEVTCTSSHGRMCPLPFVHSSCSRTSPGPRPFLPLTTINWAWSQAA